MNFKFRAFNTCIMAMLISLIMTLCLTWINLGLVDNFFMLWMKSWLIAWPLAFVIVLILMRPVMAFSKKVFGIKD